MAAEEAILKATQALRPLRDLVYNHIAFEEEVKASLNSLFQKHREEQSSLERVRQSQISAASLIEGEVKIWLKMIHRRLSPRMKARNAWRIEVKRAMPSEVFGALILQAVKKARSAYGVSYKEEKLVDTISYNSENRLLRDFSQMSQINRDLVQEFFLKKSKGTRKGTLQVVISSESPFTICFVKRTQQVVVNVHYKFTNEHGYTFS